MSEKVRLASADESSVIKCYMRLIGQGAEGKSVLFNPSQLKKLDRDLTPKFNPAYGEAE